MIPTSRVLIFQLNIYQVEFSVCIYSITESANTIFYGHYNYTSIKFMEGLNQIQPSPSVSLSIPILNYIQPPRDLLKGVNRPNCLFKKQLNPLPFVMKCCDQLYELGLNNVDPPIPINPQQAKIIYQRQIDLMIDPFQSRNFFKASNLYAKPQKNNAQIFPKEGELVFDSNFESGNLLQARKQNSGHKYHLLMQKDINTFGCTQWFFFKVLNKEKMKATFCINNFYKSQSLYRSGMKVLIFSKKKFLSEGYGWVRGTENISYFQNKGVQKREGGVIIKKYYTLKFDFNFEEENDEVFFAYNYPYTYSKLNSYLIEKAKEDNAFYNCRMLCKTLADNKISLVTITDHGVEKEKKNTIFITSRVHPGETVSSLIMEGIIDFLTSHTPVADQLRKRFIFRLIPMLNPDGVIHGNYRTNLAGIDLNRVWNKADKQLSPQIFELKKFILECHKECPIIQFCDLHGHSARKSAFIYGCDPIIKGRRSKQFQNRSRLFPFMLSSENEDFRYKSCNFMIQKGKEGTARIQLWKQLKITNVFTLQASFCSSESSEYHFRPSDYRQIGISFCKTIKEYFMNEQKKKQFSQKLKSLEDIFNHQGKQQSDSQSDTDLFNEKTISNLKNGIKNVIENRTVNFEAKQKIAEKKYSLPQKQHKKVLLNRNRRAVKTQQSSFSRITAYSPSPARKTIEASMATKRIVFDTQVIKPVIKKTHQNIFRKSILQKIQHGYRGKSSVYRIKRQLGMGESGKVFAMDSSLNYY